MLAVGCMILELLQNFFVLFCFGNNPSLGKVRSMLETQKEYKMKERKMKQINLLFSKLFCFKYTVMLRCKL